MAAGLAKQARQAEASGQIVRAYLLYTQAAAREPGNPGYRANRDALAPAAKILTKAQIQDADVSADIQTAEKQAAEKQATSAEPPVEMATKKEWERDEDLQPLPHLLPNSSLHSFDIRADDKTLFQQVVSAYGIRAIPDPQLQPEPNVRFQIEQADFRTAMEALTDVTNTFVFPISQTTIFFARDTELKRAELEPNVLLSFPLPNALDQKDLIEAANATRGVLSLKAIGWDSANRTVLIRDRYTRARVARSLLDALLLPRAQISIEVQFLTFDSDRSYHYGASLPTAYQLVDFGHIGGFQNIIPSLTNPPTFLAFGGGATLFGIGLTNATLFASYAKSFSQTLFDATVVIADGQTANFHVGDKYPIPQSIYTGFSQSASSIYNPTPQVTLEDLGLVLKLTPRVNGEGDISMDVEADYKSLGSITFDNIPSIGEREFKGTVSLREGQSAVLAGMDTSSQSITRNGLAGVSKGVFGQLFAENTRDTQASKTLLVLKPTITRLPMSSEISPQYFIGPQHGERVLM